MGQTVCQKLNKEILANSLYISEPLIKKIDTYFSISLA